MVVTWWIVAFLLGELTVSDMKTPGEDFNSTCATSVVVSSLTFYTGDPG